MFALAAARASLSRSRIENAMWRRTRAASSLARMISKSSRAFSATASPPPDVRSCLCALYVLRLLLLVQLSLLVANTKDCAHQEHHIPILIEQPSRTWQAPENQTQIGHLQCQYYFRIRLSLGEDYSSDPGEEFPSLSDPS